MLLDTPPSSTQDIPPERIVALNVDSGKGKRLWFKAGEKEVRFEF